MELLEQRILTDGKVLPGGILKVDGFLKYIGSRTCLQLSFVRADELCRLIVLNTASIQILPATVAALRSGLGCGTPLDILPAVWVTSLLSAGLGISAAGLLGKVWRS